MIEKIELSQKIPAKVVENILSSIFKGKIKSGEELVSEEKLSKMLSVSRGSLREGLAILEFLGVFEVKGNKKIVSNDHKRIMKAMKLIELSKKDELIFDMLELRRVIENYVINLVCQRACKEDLTKIKDAASCLIKDKIDDINIDNNFNFHIAIAEATHNPFLISLVELLVYATNAFRERSKVYRNIKISKLEHYNIFKAISKNDVDLACQKVNILFSNIEKSIKRGIESSKDTKY